MPTDRRDEALGGEAARSLFSKFRTLLEANTAALATMAVMERMLGGEYIFDRTFLEKSAREVADFTYQAVYAVNAMTGNRFVTLYDRFMAITAVVEDILTGRQQEADDDQLVRSLSQLRLEDRPQVGPEGAALGELAGQLGLFVPRGFAVTHAAWSNGNLVPEAAAAIAAALGVPPEGPPDAAMTVVVTVSGADVVTAWRKERGVPARGEDLVAALGGLARVALIELGDAAGGGRIAAAVTAEVPAILRGRIWTAWREGAEPAFLRLDVWPEDDPAARETLILDRSHPFAVQRKLPAEPVAAGPSHRGLQLSDAFTLPLAGQALAAERLLGAPLALEFCQDPTGRFVFESVRFLPQLPAAVSISSGPGEVLLSGGEVACLGAASGEVVPVDETTATTAFPFGAVAVARSASPALAPLLRRAGAMVAEVGDAAGHLAAVAREYRVPALFGLPGALTVLTPGLVVTVDAEVGLVTRGAAPSRPAPESGLSPDDPEYQNLRRLLRHIARLTLTDPNAPNFSVEGCRTLHDLLHFAHARAVDVLADLRQVGFSEHLAIPLSLPVPLDLRVLDIGGGLASGAVGLEAVRSRPLAALLAGMLVPGMWDTTPARVGLGEILGAMAKTMPETGGNLAIAARSYCNVSLRLGYHFTVIDAYIGSNPEKNSISFRYVGGLADAAGRAARAAFIRQVLARQDFKVEVTGDLVVARLKLIEPETAEEVLRLLGSLCAFARQRDTGLSNMDDARALQRLFFEIRERSLAQQEKKA